MTETMIRLLMMNLKNLVLTGTRRMKKRCTCHQPTECNTVNKLMTSGDTRLNSTKTGSRLSKIVEKAPRHNEL